MGTYNEDVAPASELADGVAAKEDSWGKGECLESAVRLAVEWAHLGGDLPLWFQSSEASRCTIERHASQYGPSKCLTFPQ